MRQILEMLIEEENAFRASHQDSPSLEELSPGLKKDLEDNVNPMILAQGFDSTKLFLQVLSECDPPLTQ